VISNKNNNIVINVEYAENIRTSNSPTLYENIRSLTTALILNGILMIFMLNHMKVKLFKLMLLYGITKLISNNSKLIINSKTIGHMNEKKYKKGYKKAKNRKRYYRDKVVPVVHTFSKSYTRSWHRSTIVYYKSILSHTSDNTISYLRSTCSSSTSN